MSIESLEAGAFVVNPPHQDTYSTVASETNFEHFEEVDHRIRNSLDGARDEIIISNRTIGAHTQMLETEVALEEARIIDRAQLERIEARREYERLMDELTRTYEKQVREINHDESESLEEIRQTGVDGKEFFAACKRVGDTINEAVAQYGEQHLALTQTVDTVYESLFETQAEIVSLDASRQDKTKQREELLRVHEATELITGRNRQKRIDLMRSSVDTTDAFHKQRQDLEHQSSPQSDTEINQLFGDFEQHEFAFHREHSEIMARVGVLDDEIEAATLENRQRDEQIKRLRYEMVALKAEADGLREYIGTLKDYLTRLDGMKQELDQITAALHDRAEALQVIVRGGFEAIDCIPIELQEIVMAALNMKRSHADSEAPVDYAVAIPEIGHSIIKVGVTSEGLGVSGLASAVRSEKNESEEVPVSSITPVEVLEGTVEKLTEDVDALREWVQQSALRLLPDAAKVIPQKIIAPGVRAHVKAGAK